MRALPGEPKTTSAPRLLEHHLRRLLGDPDFCVETYHNRSGERKTYILRVVPTSQRTVYLELWMCALLVHELRSELGPLPPVELHALLFARATSWRGDVLDKVHKINGLIEDTLHEINLACVVFEGRTGERRPCMRLYSHKTRFGKPSSVDASHRFLLEHARPLTWEEFERFAEALVATESFDVPRLAQLWNEHAKERMWA